MEEWIAQDGGITELRSVAFKMREEWIAQDGGITEMRSKVFKMREDYHFFYEHGLISITAYWTTVIHIPFSQLNVMV